MEHVKYMFETCNTHDIWQGIKIKKKRIPIQRSESGTLYVQHSGQQSLCLIFNHYTMTNLLIS
jgi:hypothetical protein